jgi:hypothetical protein
MYNPPGNFFDCLVRADTTVSVSLPVTCDGALAPDKQAQPLVCPVPVVEKYQRVSIINRPGATNLCLLLTPVEWAFILPASVSHARIAMEKPGLARK